MKKLRILSILLVIFMLFSSFSLIMSCDKDDVDDNGDEGGDGGAEDKSSSTKSTKSRTQSAIAALPDGYIVYENFEDMTVGASWSANSGYVQNAIKLGASFTIIDTDHYSEGASTANALQFYREELADLGGESADSFVNIVPTASKLEQVYVLQFDWLYTAENATNFEVTARKTSGSSGVFTSMIQYNVSTNTFVAKGTGETFLVPEVNTWYTIGLVIDDENRIYDVYVDGYKLLEGIPYASSSFPKQSETAINLYRMTIPSSKTRAEFYLDNIFMYNGNTVNDYQGSKVPNYATLELPDIVIFDADAKTDPTSYITDMTKVKGYEGAESGIELGDAIALTGVNSDGNVEVLTPTYGEATKDISAGYDYYLKFSHYVSLQSQITFTPTQEYMESLGIEATTDIKGQLAYDISNYTTLTVEFYMPPEVSQKTAFTYLMIMDCGNNAEGWSYYSTSFKSNGTQFTNNNGFYTYTLNLKAMSISRSATYDQWRFFYITTTGWNNGLNGDGKTTSDDYDLYIKSIKVSGSIKLTLADDANGDENCTHTDENGESTMKLETIAPTCLERGYKANVCSLCHYTEVTDHTSLIPATGHKYEDGERDIVYPTCTTAGSCSAACDYCGTVAVIEKYSASGHSYVTKIDSVKKQLKMTCSMCGETVTAAFAESLPKYDEFKAAITATGATMGGALDLSSVSVGTKTVDTSYNSSVSPATGGLSLKYGQNSIVLRQAGIEIFDNEGVDNVGKYVRAYNKTDINYLNSSNHSYSEMQMTKVCSDDFVWEISIRLGDPDESGKWGASGFQLIDRTGNANAGAGNIFLQFAWLEADGTIKLSNSDYVVELSQEHFTHIAFSFHPAANSFDLYIDGVMVVKDIVMTTANYDMASFSPSAIRYLQLNATAGLNSWYDYANEYHYFASMPIAIVDVNLSGVVEAFSGNIFKLDFSKALEELEGVNVNANGIASIAGNALVIKNDAEDTVFADISILEPKTKQNTDYVISLELAANATAKSTVLLQGVKGNYYGETLYEDILYIDADGDIIFYNQVIGNIADGGKFDLVVSEENDIITVYVDGEYVAEGAYASDDYGNDEEEVYLTGFRLGCANGSYTVNSMYVYTGDYEG